MVECHLINLFNDFSAFIVGMWKEKFEADRFTEALANDVEEKLGPTHKPRKKTFAF